MGHNDHAISVAAKSVAPTPWHAALRIADKAARAAATHLVASRSRLNLAFLMQRSPEQMARSIESEAHELICAEIRRAYPDHGLIGPRDGIAASRLDSGAVWLVDALDGAAAYLAGRPHFAVSVALVVNGQVRVATVADPTTHETFRAIAGVGAWLDRAGSAQSTASREPLYCSVRGECSQAHAATVFPPPGSHRMPTYLGEIGRVMRSFKSVQRTGAPSLALANLAAGRLDAFWAHDQPTCDIAAGLLLVQQAGCEVRARDGLPLLHSRSIAVNTPSLAYDFHALLTGQ